MAKHRVFVLTSKIDVSRFDISPAREYGELIWIAKGGNFPNGGELVPFVIDRLREEEFDQDNDFLLLTGPPAALAIFVAAAFTAYSRLRLLTYVRTQEGYNEIEIQWTPELEEPFEEGTPEVKSYR